ncbi:uncharacterized protein LOC131022162 [Salvia miltiorrhiza]|uniref:uncharacterized protein LOC131022162 n=1 Tax=Salvia miltiorrhiza TaxID=226208 RepID=UPI0025AD72FC|nr:uncharacterized protein LOC131022162 [Salvia miltiorrhiza]
MGNCLVLQEKVMKTDGEILEHLLVKNMHPNAQVLQNNLHFSIKTTTKKKAVRFSDKVLMEGGDEASRVVRIKLVISKKELQEMLSEGEISVDGMILKVQNQETTSKVESNDRDGVIAKGWFPALESIPEIN